MSKPLIDIPGLPPSAEVRDRLRAEGKPVLLAFSGGKDAIAAWLALRDSGVEVVPCYLYLVPGLEFIEESLDKFERFFGEPIGRMPHPTVYRWLKNFVFQPPEHLVPIASAGLEEFDYSDIWGAFAESRGMEPGPWVADGVRAADSIVRRVSFKTHGVMKPSNRKVSPVWDWRVSHVWEAIESSGAPVPPDYDWFNRSFDGLDKRFLEPLKKHAPADFERVLEFFPLAEMELFRHDL